MNSTANYFITGLFVLTMFLVGIASFFWFSKVDDEDNYTTYRIYFTESVAGLSESSPVKYNGVKVGFVKEIAISQVNYRQTNITVEILKDTPITDETYATIISRGITGISYIGLKTLIPFGKRLVTPPGEMYPVIKSSPSLLLELDKTINDITINIKSFVNKFEKLLDDENLDSIKTSLKSVGNISSKVDNNMDKFVGAMEKVNSVLDKTDVWFEKMPNLVDKASNTLDQINHASNSISKVSATVNKTAKALNYTGDAVSDLVEENLKNLATALEILINNLSVVIDSLKENPSMLIRGAYQKPELKYESNN